MPNIQIQPELMKRARINGLNVSAVARRAVKEACERLERIETGPSRQELSPVHKPPVSINEGCNER